MQTTKLDSAEYDNIRRKNIVVVARAVCASKVPSDH